MDVANPQAAITPTLDGPVLSVLAGTTRPLTGLAVARLASRGSRKGVQLVLNRLVDQGVVLRQEAGRAALFELNREHVAAPAAEALARIRSEFFERLEEEVRSWAITPDHASLFGSAARGDGRTGSDIDLLVVRPDETPEDDEVWHGQLDRLSERVLAWTGNHAAILEISPDDVERLRTERPAVVDELERDAINLGGRDLVEFLGGSA